ncbi:hypothetical protein KL921_000899 [Ogataea angusta]|nr:hypothetical protein KL921_000899 [Ogataea angusta]
MILTIKRPNRDADVPQVPSSRPRRSESSDLPELEIPAVPSTRPKPKDEDDTKSSKGSFDAEIPSLPAVPATRPRKAATLDHIKTDSTVEPAPGTPTYQNVLDIYAQSPEQLKKVELHNVWEDDEPDRVGMVDREMKDTELHEATNDIDSLEHVSSAAAPEANETTKVTSMEESTISIIGIAEADENHSEETKGELSPQQEPSVIKEKNDSNPKEPIPPKNEESTQDEDHEPSKSKVTIPDPASNSSSLEPTNDPISKKSSDMSLGISPRSSTDSNKPAVPKKPSSKIAAFQQMLAERQQQDMGMFKSKPPVPTKRPSQVADDSDHSDAGVQHVRKPLIGFPLPGMAFPGTPMPGMPFAQPESDDATDHVEDVRKGRIKGPRGRKLPSRVKDSVQVNDETLGNKLNIIVTTSWNIDLRKPVKIDEELQNNSLPSVDKDRDSDGSTIQAQETDKLAEEQHENSPDDEHTEIMNEDRPDLETEDFGTETTRDPVSPSVEDLNSKNDVSEPCSEGSAPNTLKSQEAE